MPYCPKCGKGYMKIFESPELSRIDRDPSCVDCGYKLPPPEVREEKKEKVHGKVEEKKEKVAHKMGSREVMEKLSPNRRYQSPKEWAKEHRDKSK